MDVKNGVNTSEFWLSLLAVILTAVGPEFSNMPGVYKVIGAALAVLAALGYTASRTILKNTAANNATVLNAITPTPPPLADPAPGSLVQPTVTPIVVNTPLHPDNTPIGSVPGN